MNAKAQHNSTKQDMKLKNTPPQQFFLMIKTRTVVSYNSLQNNLQSFFLKENNTLVSTLSFLMVFSRRQVKL